MRPFILAGALALTANAAGAVAMSKASGSLSLTLIGDQQILDQLSISFPDFGLPNPFSEIVISPADPGGVTGGVLTIGTENGWPGGPVAASPFDGGASVSVTAGPAAQLVSGGASGFFTAALDIENFSGADLSFGLDVAYTLHAEASIDDPFAEDAFSNSILFADFLPPASNAPISSVDDSAFADVIFGPPSETISDTLMLRDIMLADGEFLAIDITLFLDASAESAKPIPVPPALALLPAGLGLLVAAGRRRRA